MSGTPGFATHGGFTATKKMSEEEMKGRLKSIHQRMLEWDARRKAKKDVVAAAVEVVDNLEKLKKQLGDDSVRLVSYFNGAAKYYKDGYNDLFDIDTLQRVGSIQDPEDEGTIELRQ